MSTDPIREADDVQESRSTSSSGWSSTTTSFRPGAAASRAAGRVDAQVGSTAGYGLDLDGDDRFDGGRDGVLGFDLDRNDRLDESEIGYTRAALQAFAGRYDRDGDGQVSAEEDRQGRELQAIVQRYDGDGDGRLSGAELKGAGARVQTAQGTRQVDDLVLDGQAARLRHLDPDGAVIDLDALDEATGSVPPPAGAAPTDDAPADDPASAQQQQPGQASAPSSSGGPASPKGPTVSNPNAPAGFLWKPVSDSDGNLAILLPPNMTGKVNGVNVLSPEGQVLESGRASGVGNGGREHFRFKRPGGSFPPGCQVQILFKDGSQQTIPIENPGVRNEGR